MSHYVQITTVCNYKCPHCCFSCTEKGKHMSIKTFKQVLKYIEGDENIVIGGGEPTLHPKFWDIIGLCLTSGYYGSNLWMASNGSQKEIMSRLSDMARNGIMSVSISNDRFHPPLDPDIKRWFTKDKNIGSSTIDLNRHYDNDYRGFHGPMNPIKIGRSKTGIKACCCEGPFINPKGDIYHCGCPKSPKIGDVWEGIGDWDRAFDTCGLKLEETEETEGEEECEEEEAEKDEYLL